MAKERHGARVAARLFPGLPLRPGAAVEEIESVERSLGRRLPDDYRRFLEETDGVEGFIAPDAFVSFWRIGDLPSLNSGYSTGEFAPGLVLIGTDGGGTGYGVVERAGDAVFVRVPLVGLSSDSCEPVGQTFASLLGQIKTTARAGMRTVRFRGIIDSAAACDGGSLALALARTDGSRASLVLDQSIKSRGTPSFGTVSLDGVLVSGSASSDLSTELQRLNDALSQEDRSKHPVSQFIEALGRQGPAPTPTALEHLEELDIGPRPANVTAGPVWRELVGPGRTVTLSEAVGLAERAFSESDMGVLAMQEFDFGWVMALQGRRYMATRAFQDELVGHGLTIVERATGDVYCSGSASPGWIAVLGYFSARASHRAGDANGAPVPAV